MQRVGEVGAEVVGEAENCHVAGTTDCYGGGTGQHFQQLVVIGAGREDIGLLLHGGDRCDSKDKLSAHVKIANDPRDGVG